MISREHFIQALEKETNICKHLYTKIPTDAFDFRPNGEQRSMLELLRYLSICGSAPMHIVTHGNDWKLWKPYTASSLEMQPGDFPAAMDKQLADMIAMINTIPEEDLHSKEAKHPTGELMPLGVGLIRMSLSWLTAYRMQLFLYLKQAGVPELGTSNNWAGMDRVPR